MSNHDNELNHGEFCYLPYELIIGKVDSTYFKLLISISSITSPKMRKALEDILVHGCARKEACIKNNVSQGAVSMKVQHLQYVNQTVHMMSRYSIHM